MEPTTDVFYQLRGQYYLGDGVYLWEDVDAQCDTLEGCLKCKDYAERHSPEYVDFMVEHKVVVTTLILAPENNIESDMER